MAEKRSEWQKMIAGELYNAQDPELVARRANARRILRLYNASTELAAERDALLQELLGRPPAGLWIEPPFHCDYGANIVVGRNVYFNFSCIVLDVAPVTIGDNALFGPAVQIYTATHPLAAAERRAGLESGKPVRIGADVWVGGATVINPGVTIGDRTVVGSGSVVSRDLPGDVFAAGNPCRVIRHLDTAAGEQRRTNA